MLRRAAPVLRHCFSLNVFVRWVPQSAQAVIGIEQGHLPALNPTEPASAAVFVHNNIFFTRSPDPRQLPGADVPAPGVPLRPASSAAAAPRSRFSDAPAAPGATAHADLANNTPSNHTILAVAAVSSIDVPGLHTLLLCHVTIHGRRYVAQSLIPGILHGQKATTMVYGSVDNGASVAAEPEFHALLERLATRLHIGKRVVTPAPASAAEGRPDVAGNVGPSSCAASEPVEVYGAVESKGVRGADGLVRGWAEPSAAVTIIVTACACCCRGTSWTSASRRRT